MYKEKTVVYHVDSCYNAEKNFTTLIARQKAPEVKLFFYHVVLPKLPKIEKFNLNLQIKKAAVSATANISEGYSSLN